MNLAGVCYFWLTKKHLAAAAGLVSIISAEDDLSPGRAVSTAPSVCVVKKIMTWCGGQVVSWNCGIASTFLAGIISS